MATYNIDLPPGANVTMQEGDTLNITFKSAAKFCLDSGNANDFNPALPAGVPQSNGDVWSGEAVVTNATISYSHVGNDKTCGSGNLTDTGPHTIQIGSGTE